jgi:hypothetical protein
VAGSVWYTVIVMVDKAQSGPSVKPIYLPFSHSDGALHNF